MVLLSPKLWIPLGREFPLVPAFGSLPIQFVPLIDVFLTIGMLLGLLAYLWRPLLRIGLVVFLGCTSALILEDITRFQPWIYVYSAILLVWSWRTEEKHKLNLAWVILGSLYFWSGFQKLNHAFTVEILPWMMEAMGLEAFFAANSTLGYAVGAIELCIGLGLLHLKTRKWAVFGALFTHAFILFSTGPLGANWNSVIWPWNLAMMAMLVLFVTMPQSQFLSWWKFKSLRRLGIGLVVLLWFLPILNYFRLWDSHLSGSLYSGNNSEAIFFFQESDRGNMPSSAREFMFFQEEPPGQEFILLDHWILDELNAPFYPETRYFKWLGRQMCGCVNEKEKAGLSIVQKAKFSSEQTLLTFSCTELSN